MDSRILTLKIIFQVLIPIVIIVLLYRRRRKKALQQVEEKANPNEPILDFIADHMVDGRLPELFSLKDFDELGNNIRYADGAKDGILLSHFGLSPLPGTVDTKIDEALMEACKGNYESADQAFLDLAAEFRIVELVDKIQERILRKSSFMDENALYSYAIASITSSTKKPLPKVGLTIMELYGEPEDRLKGFLRTLGLSDEYTLFVAWNMRHWENGNVEMLELAKYVHGWGRISIVKIIDPVSDEIRRWLLFNGVDNHIGSFECALECYTKSGANDLMRLGMTQEEFEAVGSILVGLLEGPSKDYSSIENWPDLLRIYVDDASTRELGLGDYERLLYFMEAGEARGFVDFKEQCDRLLQSEECRDAVKASIKDGEGIDIAKYIGVPYEAELLDCIEADFQHKCHLCSYVLDDQYFNRLIEVFRVNIPPSTIGDVPLDETGFGKEWSAHRQLLFLLQELRHKLPEGLDMVLMGLSSPVINNRSMALRDLKCWVDDERKPLRELSPSAHSALERVYGMEPCESIKKAIKPLLGDVCEFDPDDL